MSFGAFAHGLAAAAFLAVAVLLLVARQGRRQYVPFAVASALTSGWAAIVAWQAAGATLASLVLPTAETIRSAAWLVAVGLAARSALPTANVRRGLTLGLLVLVVLLLGPAVARRLDPDWILPFQRLALVLAIAGLVLLEQVYRNADAASLPSRKQLVLGVGGLFAYDLFLYAQAELLHGVSQTAWDLRGLANAFCVPFIVLAIPRSSSDPSSIFVSRHVVFHTTALLIIGLYLLLMALGGYYVRIVGGSWGGVAQGIFLLSAFAALILLVFFSQLRRRLAVFIAKHFYRNKYDYRLEWLRFINTLSQNTEGDVKRTAVRAVTQIFDSPGGFLLLLDESGRILEAAASWPMSMESVPGLSDLPGDAALPRFLREKGWIIDLAEYRASPAAYDNVALPAWILENRELRIISPMMELGRLTGVFVLYGPPDPFSMTFEDRDLLKTVGQHVATQVAQHEADRKLAESRQFEAYNRLTAFLMHDLKNCAAQLNLLAANAARHKSNPEFIDDAMSTVANAAARMTRLIEHLARRQDQPAVRSVHVHELLVSAVRACADRAPVPRLMSAGQGVVVQADPDRLGAILEHVIRNAQDASAPDAELEVELVATDAEVTITVSDQGHGMTATFVRERLFRPFDSTKGAKGMGIGAYQAREYVRMLGGDVKVQSTPGSGTHFSIILPRAGFSTGSDVLPTPSGQT